MPTKTLKVRVKDKHAKQLQDMSRSVNFVWNYINELSIRSIKDYGRFLSAYDLHPYTKGAGKELGLHSHTLQCIASEYATRRKQFKKRQLRWRASNGAKRSLGWVPINTGASSWKNGQVFHNGQYFKVWDSYGLSDYKFRSASFNEDARGRWYFNVVVAVKGNPNTAKKAVGVDLGCKDSATTSNGEVLHGRWYRELEVKLAIAQRAKKKRRVRAIHAKVANRRKDGIHKFTTELVNNNAAIFVGNVSSKKLVKTRMAKSVLDAGWGMVKSILEYKSDHAGVHFEVVDESFSTRVCSGCGIESGPKGLSDLNKREWDCIECGEHHLRDVNAAINIMNRGLGHQPLAVGIPRL